MSTVPAPAPAPTPTRNGDVISFPVAARVDLRVVPIAGVDNYRFFSVKMPGIKDVQVVSHGRCLRLGDIVAEGLFDDVGITDDEHLKDAFEKGDYTLVHLPRYPDINAIVVVVPVDVYDSMMSDGLLQLRDACFENVYRVKRFAQTAKRGGEFRILAVKSYNQIVVDVDKDETLDVPFVVTAHNVSRFCKDVPSAFDRLAARPDMRRTEAVLGGQPTPFLVWKPANAGEIRVAVANYSFNDWFEQTDPLELASFEARLSA